MTNTAATANAGLLSRFRTFFKSRDIFLHDGRNLRRFTIGAHVQMAAALAAFLFLAWCAYATFSMLAAMNGDVAQMERRVAAMQADVDSMRREAQSRAQLLERRQAFLAAMLSGEADADDLAQLLPEQPGTPETRAAQAVAQSYDAVDGQQILLAARANDATRQRYRETAQMLRQLGLNPARFHRRGGGVGGPFEAASDADNADPRFRELFTSWRRLEQLEQAVIAIPAGQPVRTASFTSGYGVRSDPFRGRAAMHAGIDLAGPHGSPIYATADGIVATAEYNRGGYGNLIEINHGQGMQTRYAHLSRMSARPGQRIRRGDVIGYMGSTGRSTGSHLHYEVRIDGRPVNPVPFMQSSDTLIALQRRADTPIVPVALGGPSEGQR